MRIAAHRGNRLHAPENTRIAMLSAYTAGADVLELDVQLTSDGHLVVSHDGTTDRLTDHPGIVPDMTLKDLRRLDFSRTFRPRGSAGFRYRPRGRQAIETLPEVLDLVPDDVELLVELKHDSSSGSGRREEFVGKAVAALVERDLGDRAVVYSKDPENLSLVRKLAPDIGVAAFDWELGPDQQLDLLRHTGADGLVTDVASVVAADGDLTEMGRQLEGLHRSLGLRVGAVLYPYRHPAVFSPLEFEALRDREFVWSISSDSLLEVGHLARPSRPWVEESFAGTAVDTSRWSFGYAKANPYCHVFQDDGVHVKIEPYDRPPPAAAGDPLERRLQRLEEGLWFAAREWPFYSGGGVGLVPGIVGDFVAEVDYEVERVGQATTLEMAVVNVDPGAHHPPWNPDGTKRVPTSFRDKASFFDPHGAPPFVGAEHDEDDGLRINWNLGTEYDGNRYGRPVGDGTVLAGRLRLERRGRYFSAYYRNDHDATDWVCVGSARNDSMNPQVFLRCAAKRWRQERDDDPGQFWPILANEFVFRNLVVYRLAPSASSRG